MRTLDFCALVAAAWLPAARGLGVEERIRGVLEKTAKEGALAQITDALKEIYYVSKSDAAEKLCKDLIGKRVVLTGTVEQHAGDADFFLVVVKAEEYNPQLPAVAQPGEAKSGAAEKPAGDPPLPLPPEKKTGSALAKSE